jgi:hypothetical protein
MIYGARYTCDLLRSNKKEKKRDEYLIIEGKKKNSFG